MHLSKDPVSVFLAALPMGTDRLRGDPPKSSHLQAEQALFPQPLLTGKVLQTPDCLGGPL